MKLIFVKDGSMTIFPRNETPQMLRRITGCSAMVIQSMRGGIPLVHDGGQYKIVNEDLSEISEKNFGL